MSAIAPRSEYPGEFREYDDDANTFPRIEYVAGEILSCGNFVGMGCALCRVTLHFLE